MYAKKLALQTVLKCESFIQSLGWFLHSLTKEKKNRATVFFWVQHFWLLSVVWFYGTNENIVYFIHILRSHIFGFNLQIIILSVDYSSIYEISLLFFFCVFVSLTQKSLQIKIINRSFCFLAYHVDFLCDTATTKGAKIPGLTCFMV